MYSEHCEMLILIIIITIVIIISSSYYHYHYHQHHYIHFYYYYHYYQCYREKTVGNNRDSVFIIIVPFMMNANSRIRFCLQIVFVCLYITPSHYHHFANLSEDIELMKCLSDIFLSSVWVRLSILFQLSIIQYMGLCVFSSPSSLVMIERIYTLSYCHHLIRSMNYHQLFWVRSWNNGMRCMSLLYFHSMLRIANWNCIILPSPVGGHEGISLSFISIATWGNCGT